MIVGITGRYCAGKTALASLFEKHGFLSINVDEIGHLALAYYSETIISTFGKEIDDGQGGINRRVLGNMVFANPSKLTSLEKIVHPWMYQYINTTIEANLQANWIIEAAILHKLNLHLLCKQVIIVHSPWIIRLFRALRRDKISILQAIQRLQSQAHIPNKLRSNKARKKTLNNISYPTELLVSGTYGSALLEKKILVLLEDATDGTISINKQ